METTKDALTMHYEGLKETLCNVNDFIKAPEKSFDEMTLLEVYSEFSTKLAAISCCLRTTTLLLQEATKMKKAQMMEAMHGNS